MKKTLLGIMSFAALSIAVVSCSEEEQTPLEPGTATVSGRVEANLDEANDTLSNGTPETKLEAIPEGTVITFVVNGMDLDHDPDPGYNYKDKNFTATVGSDGTYSVDIDARETPFDVTVKFDDFAADVVRWSNDPGDTTANGMPATITEREVFMKGDETVTIWDGATIVRDFDY